MLEQRKRSPERDALRENERVRVLSERRVLKEKERQCVCMCVCERKRERERERERKGRLKG